MKFLEQEQISPRFGLASRHNLKQDIIDKGNAAAHCGNLLADHALFKSGLIKDDYQKLFHSLYWTSGKEKPSASILSGSYMVIQAIKCCVSINAG
jgi:hypothetical protein